MGDAREITERIESHTADVGTHLSSLPLSCRVEDARLEAKAEVLVEANLEVALALRRVQLLRDEQTAADVIDLILDDQLTLPALNVV